MAMNGIDISGHQSGIDIAYVPADFVIIKITEGCKVWNHDWQRQAEDALASGKLIGFYVYGNYSDPAAEARFFADQAKDYFGKATFWLDWESNPWFNDDNWPSQFRAAWEEYTGLPIGIYTAYWKTNALAAFDYTWIPQYPDYSTVYGYQDSPWNEGAYYCDIRQYTSCGRLDNFGGNLDLNKCYQDKDWWYKMCGKTGYEQEYELVQDPRIDTFCELMNHWCCEMDMYYSQANRQNFVYGGSMDCSSCTNHCLEEAGFEIGGSTYTGNMSVNLTALGWERVPADGNPQRGDILLNDIHHVGIWDGEYCIEFGGDPHQGYVTKHGYYDYPWDCYLRYPLIEVRKEDEMAKYTEYRAAEEIISQYYEALLHRKADFCGLMAHTNSYINGKSLLDIAFGFISSEEWQNMEECDGVSRIRDFYLAFLGREPEEGAAQGWVEACGGDLYKAAESIYYSEEGKNRRELYGL